MGPFAPVQCTVITPTSGSLVDINMLYAIFQLPERQNSPYQAELHVKNYL